MKLQLAAIGLLLATTTAAYAETAPCGGTNCQPIGWFTSHQVCDSCNGGDGTFVPPPPPPPPPGYGSGGTGGAAPAGGVPPPPLTERRGG